MHKTNILAAAFATVGLMSAWAAPAAADWPERDVNILVPFAAGGGTDPVARIVFADMAERLKVAFPIEFRPGAGGTIGASAAAKADPDGYTILFTSAGPLVNANFYPTPLGYDPKTDFLPVMQVATITESIVANKNTPFNTFEELIAAAKAKPNTINVSVGGPGSGSHVAASIVEYKTGVTFNKVPYGGPGDALKDLLSGVIDVGFGFPTGFLPGVKAGQLKYIAFMSDKAVPSMPDVPFTDQTQYKGVYDGGWLAFFVPKGTPRAVIDKINAETKITLSKPEVMQKINALGYDITATTPEGLAKIVADDIEDTKQFVKDTGYKF